MSADTAAVGSAMTKRNSTIVLTCPVSARGQLKASARPRRPKTVDAGFIGDTRTGRTGPRLDGRSCRKADGMEADQGSEAVDPEGHQDHYDDIHPPHVD